MCTIEEYNQKVLSGSNVKGNYVEIPYKKAVKYYFGEQCKLRFRLVFALDIVILNWSILVDFFAKRH